MPTIALISGRIRKWIGMFAVVHLLGICVARSGSDPGPQFQQFLDRVNKAPSSEKGAIVDSFLNLHPVLPFIEQDSLCHFLYRGSAASVAIPGDANWWNAAASWMVNVSGTNLWYDVENYPPSARLEYLFVVDGTTWIKDPRNPRVAEGTANSELRMPAYLPPKETAYNPNIPYGTFWDTTLYSATLGNSRTVRVYLPPSYNMADSFAVVLFHDGLDYISAGFAVRVMTYLQAYNRIQPVIGVFLPPVNRSREYVGDQQDQYAAFVATEVMPIIDARYRTKRNPMNRATIGISNGGNIALWIASNYPEVFGCAGSCSGAIQPATYSRFRTSDIPLKKVYVDVGLFDLQGFYDLSANFRQALQEKGYTYQYYEWPEGHSWLNWGAHLDNFLEYFTPGSALGVKEDQPFATSAVLYQNYPNPFNPSTGIKYTVGVASGQWQVASVKLVVYDLLGREVAVLVNERKQSGTYEARFDGSGLASGVYFYRLQVRPLDSAKGRDSRSGAGDFLDTKKLLLMR